MNAVAVQKAGVASGVLQMSRMVGASVGVAATGAIFQSQLGSGFDPASLAAAPDAARAVFVDALGSAMLLSAVMAVLGLVVAVTLLRGGRVPTEAGTEPAAAADRREKAPAAAPATEAG
jgi:hypothetical protein